MSAIKNSDDLRIAISQLKRSVNVQQIAIKKRFSNPKTIFKTVISLVPKSLKNESKRWKLWLKPSLRYLPLIVNQLFLKRSSFLVRSLIGLAGQLSSRFL